MDLPQPQKSTLSCISAVKNRKRKAPNKYGSIQEITPKRLYYSPPTHRQRWSLPESYIHYIAKNPTSSELFEKMIRTCKYFFYKSRIIVCSTLTYAPELIVPQTQEDDNIVNLAHNIVVMEVKDVWKIEENGKEKTVNLNDQSTKLWITQKLHVASRDLVSSIIPNIYRCEAIILHLWNQKFSFNEYIFLTTKAQRIWLRDVTVTHDDDGGIVAVEKLIEVVVHAKTFCLRLGNNDTSVSSDTVKNLIKLPHFSSLSAFRLTVIPEALDIDALYKYLKTNKKTVFALEFSPNISEEYVDRLSAITDEILDIEEHQYKPPFINFQGLSIVKYVKLRQISLSF